MTPFDTEVHVAQFLEQFAHIPAFSCSFDEQSGLRYEY